MKIAEKIEARAAEFDKDPTGTAHLMNALRDKAIAAVLGGVGSKDWEKYMQEHVTNSKQLARLTGKDDFYQKEDYGPQVLAYIVSNAMCGEFTTGKLLRFLDKDMIESLDKDLPVEPD